MVSYVPYGRLGNALFMAANCLAYAQKHGLDFSIPNRSTDPYWNPTPLPHLYNPKWDPSAPMIRIDEKAFHYTELPFEESWRGSQILLNGYFQSWKYLKGYRKKILNLFAYQWKFNEGVVSCHVRRGDYVNLRNKHPEVTKEWYEGAMSLFPGKRFVFVSDDIPWCRQQFGHREDCSFSQGMGIEEDLVMASCCEHNICSPSTYSFWIYYLNQNPDKKGVFPNFWFTPGWDNADTKDILPPEVIKL